MKTKTLTANFDYLLRQVPLTLDDWGTIVAWAAPILLVDEILKAIGRWIYREERREKAAARNQS
jgi:hypothetical protein